MGAPNPSEGEMQSRIEESALPPPMTTMRVIVLEGDLDIDTSPGLRQELESLIAAGVLSIVVDCAALEYIDSTGLGTLISALKQMANRSGALALAQPNERVSRMLRVTGLNGLFPIYPAVGDACAALGYPDAAAEPVPL